MWCSCICRRRISSSSSSSSNGKSFPFGTPSITPYLLPLYITSPSQIECRMTFPLFVDYWGLCGGVVELLTGVSRGLYIRELPTLFTLGGISIHDWLWLFCWLFLGVVSLIRVLPTKCISFCFWFWLRAELRGAELSKSPLLVSLLCNYSVHAQCAMPKTVFWKYFRKSRKPQSHRKEILRKINQK